MDNNTPQRKRSPSKSKSDASGHQDAAQDRKLIKDEIAKAEKRGPLMVKKRRGGRC